MERKLAIENGKELSFPDVASIVKWSRKEQEYWGWIDSTFSFYRTISPLLQRLEATANNVITHPEHVSYQNDLSTHLRQLGQLIEEGRYIRSGTPIAGFIASEAEKDKMFAANIYEVAITPPTNSISTKIMSMALFALSEFERGLSKRSASAVRNSLSDLHSDFTSKLEQHDIEYSDKCRRFDDDVKLREKKVKTSTQNLARTLNNERSNIKNEQLNLRTDTKDKLDELIKAAKTDISEFQENIKTQMALEAPVSYWEDKKEWHGIGTILTGIVFLLYSISAVWILYSVTVGKHEGLDEYLASWEKVSLTGLAAYLAIISLGLLFARVIYRLFASQLHLWNDASERVTVIQTYLALAEKGHAKEEFLKSLMDRLFLPSSDGVVKDELGGISIADISKLSK